MQVNDFLKQHQLKSTSIRKEILHIFQTSKHALSYSDIAKVLNNGFDKSTVYRTLKIFEEKGIIHTVLGPDHVERYGLCTHAECSHNGHVDSHIHFYCNSCKSVFCLDTIETPAVHIPNQFKAEKTEVLVFGTCNNCQ